MRKFVISINLDHAAFNEVDGDAADEVSFVLKRLANDIEFYGIPEIKTIKDHNGNTVGRAELIEDNPAPFTCATQRRAK